MPHTTSSSLTSFSAAKDFFESRIARSRTYAGSVKVVRLQNNTVLRKTYDKDFGEGYAIRLHDTDVVTYYADGTLWIECGGWPSQTTADRIHGYTPQHIRVNHRWSDQDHRLIVSDTSTGQVEVIRYAYENVNINLYR